MRKNKKDIKIYCMFSSLPNLFEGVKGKEFFRLLNEAGLGSLEKDEIRTAYVNAVEKCVSKGWNFPILRDDELLYIDEMHRLYRIELTYYFHANVFLQDEPQRNEVVQTGISLPEGEGYIVMWDDDPTHPAGGAWKRIKEV